MGNCLKQQALNHVNIRHFLISIIVVDDEGQEDQGKIETAGEDIDNEHVNNKPGDDRMKSFKNSHIKDIRQGGQKLN